jgi:hypothetical protein
MKRVFWVLAACVLALSSFSCSPRLGWGVVLWSFGAREAGKSGYLPSGTLVPVFIKSNITKTYVVGAEDGKTKLELSLWRVKFFPTKGGAENYRKEYAPVARLYGVALDDGIEVKYSPSEAEAKIYRLRNKQTVKILGKVAQGDKGKGDKPVKGNWFEVLTDDGASGFLPAATLAVFDETEQNAEGVLAALKPTDDPALDSVFAAAWRPESFGTMIKEGRYDLDAFSSRFGFFADKTLAQLTLELPDLSSVSQYSSITKIKENSYKFEGTPIQVVARGGASLVVQFIEQNGATRSLNFIAIGQDIDALVLQESDRRQAALDRIVARGPELRSSSYGALRFQPDGSFTWSGYGPLSPEAIPQGAGESGEVFLKYYPGPGIAGDCDGVLSFRFEGSGPASSVDFLYRFKGKGIQLEYSPPQCRDGITVLRRSSNPMVAYFEKAEG